MLETTQEALVAKMLDNPNDLEMFGVYADWLQENGDEDLAEEVRTYNGCIFAMPVIQSSTQQKVKFPSELVIGTVSRLCVMQAYFLKHALIFFKTQPIRRVELTDIWPIENGNRFYLYAGHFCMRDNDYIVCDELFLYMRKNAKGATQYTDYLRFDRIEDCMQTISRGCIAYGRALAGLPPLT